MGSYLSSQSADCRSHCIHRKDQYLAYFSTSLVQSTILQLKPNAPPILDQVNIVIPEVARWLEDVC